MVTEFWIYSVYGKFYLKLVRGASPAAWRKKSEHFSSFIHEAYALRKSAQSCLQLASLAQCFGEENITNCWDWEKQYSRGDEISNILIRCISILSAYLGSKFHIDYKYKMSDWEGLSASGLSKKNRHIYNETESCMKMEKLKIAPAFLD